MIINNLYVVRFLLSLLVGLFHFNLTMKSIGLTFWKYRMFDQGPFAVLVFFVLSGYLMSLTSETLDIKKFYVKRAIRILPLYYLSLFLHTNVTNTLHL